MRSSVKLSLMVCLAVSAFSQSDRGTITGTVADPTGALIPGAALSLKNSETGAAYVSRTTETGNYTLPSLPAGACELTIEGSGFRKYVQSGIQVQVATTLRLDITLQLGSATETVNVMASAPLLKTESAEQSFNVTGEQVNALPLTRS